MSNHTQNRDAEKLPTLQAVLARIESEMAEGYIGVEPTGLTFTELMCVYATLLREGRDRLFGSLRSLFRLYPAH